VKCVVIALTCGLIAGSFGVSPGLLLNPVMMVFGVHTVVGVSTVMYAVLFTTMATSFIAVVEDLLNPQYGIVVIIMTILGTYPGILQQNYIIEAYKRNSIIVSIFTFCILFCMIMIPYLNCNLLSKMD